MTWMQTVPTFTAAAAVVFGPGLAILFAGGLRRLNLVALAAPVSTSLAGCLAVVAPLLHLPFTPLVYFVTAAVASALVVAARHALRRRMHSSRPHAATLACNGRLPTQDLGRATTLLAAPVGIMIAAAVIGYRYISGFGSPENFSQTFDNIYHLNAVRHIADTLDGSSLTLGNLTEASQGFYPAAMHDSMALVVQLTDGSVPVVVNVVTIVIGALVWPLSCLFFISRIVGYRPVPLLTAGVLSAAFSAFPYLMVAFGVLYPNHAAIALLPAVLGLGIEALGMARSRGSFWAPILAVAATFPGLALTHPSTAIAFLAFLAPAVLGKVDRSRKEYRDGITSARVCWAWSGFAAFYLVALTIVWVKIRPSLGAAPWTPFQSNARALGEIVAAAPMGTTVSWILLPLTIIGLYVLARRLRRMWWILGIYAVGAVLYMVVSSWSPGPVRTLLAGVWYNDSFRLAALLPVTTLPVVVLGGEWLAWRVRAAAEWLTQSIARRGSGLNTEVLVPEPAQPTAMASAVVVWALVAVMAIMGQGGTLSNVQKRISTIWAPTLTADLVDSEELALISRIPSLVPSTDTIVANPYMGGSLVYALANRSTVAPHVFGNRTPDEETVLDHWDEAAYNATVCPAVKRLNAFWALDFGPQTVIPVTQPYVGLNDLTSDVAPEVTLVAREGHARLFHITCP